METGRTVEAIRRARVGLRMPLETEQGSTLYPMAWTLLSLYHRGPDQPLIDTHVLPTAPSELPEIDADSISLPGLEVLRAGFIGRRRFQTRLRRCCLAGESRVLGVWGLGGLGETSTMTRLARILAASHVGGGRWQDRVLALPLQAGRDQHDPFGWLRDTIDAAVRAHALCPADWSERLVAADRHAERPAALARTLLDALGARVLYIDNLESLQVPVGQAGDLHADGLPLAHPGIGAFFQVLTHEVAANATILFTTRYRIPGLAAHWELIPPCSPQGDRVLARAVGSGSLTTPR